MKRRLFIRLIGVFAVAWPLASYAQQPLPAPPKHVGVLSLRPECPSPPDSPMLRRLAELGWIEGRNIVFDCVSTFGRLDQLPALDASRDAGFAGRRLGRATGPRGGSALCDL